MHKMTGPKRWQIIVFKYPGDDPAKKGKNYINRLVGLPGESIRIKNGDLYINGEIARKPLDVQKNMWVKVYSDDFRDDLWKRYWRSNRLTPKIENGVLWLEPHDTPTMNYDKDNVDADLLYNASMRPDFEGVKDLNVMFEAEMADGSGILVDLAGNGFGFRFAVRCGQEKSSIRDGKGVVVWDGSLGLAPGNHIVECWNVDSALCLVVDGELRASFVYPASVSDKYLSSDVAF